MSAIRINGEQLDAEFEAGQALRASVTLSHTQWYLVASYIANAMPVNEDATLAKMLEDASARICATVPMPAEFARFLAAQWKSLANARTGPPEGGTPNVGTPSAEAHAFAIEAAGRVNELYAEHKAAHHFCGPECPIVQQLQRGLFIKAD